jgi:purine-binding chemotaxis protein CheW
MTERNGQQSERLVCFSLGEQTFALPIDDVREAVALRPITPVFLVPDFVRGIMNLRGEVVAVLDLLRLLRLDSRRIREHSRVVIARGAPTRYRRDHRVAGLLADTLCGVEEVAEGALEPCPATLPSGVSTYLRGVISREDRPLLLLDLDRIFNCDELLPLRQSRR